MRKALLIVAMLLLATPVMAATTISAVLEGPVFQLDGLDQQTVRIEYSTDVDVRAFALDINIDAGPTFDSIRGFKTGESTAASQGYGIFPSRFRDFIVVTGPNWADTNYNPTTAFNEPGAVNTGMGWPRMVVELGALYAEEANKPAMSGTLFRFDVNSETLDGTFHITIAANDLRGGVVNDDGNEITATYVGVDVVFQSECTVPDVVGQAEATATANIIAAGFTLGTRTEAHSDTVAVGNIINTTPAAGEQPGCDTAVAYEVSLGPCVVPNVVNQAEATATANITAAGFTLGTRTYDWSATIGKGKIISTTPASGATPGCGTAVAYVVSQGPTPVACFDPCGTTFSAQKTQYNLYITNKWDPNSWCEYPIGSGFQCHGDADGKATSAPNSYRVYTGDLTLITGNWKKKIGVYPVGANPAADIDHKATSAPNSYRVYTNDLARLTGATTGNWKRKGCTSGTGTNIPRNCPLDDASNNTYVKPAACNEGK